MKFSYTLDKQIHTSVSLLGHSENDHIFKHIKQNSSFYENSLLRYMYFIKQLSRESFDVCFDIGANIGNHSVFIGKFLTSKVVSVEPNRHLKKILLDNLSNNNTSFKLFNCGLGAISTLGKMTFSDKADNNIGMGKIVLTHDSHDAIQIDTLDNIFLQSEHYFKQQLKIFLIKIDVEGMELDVLKGALNVINSQKPHLFIEASTNDEK
ncbi:hypothetical protein DID76_00465, partial [Candidatus Marinamargulisbacteria bacterium SCGC AG-414-C22]